jgi:hypothetical protein
MNTTEQQAPGADTTTSASSKHIGGQDRPYVFHNMKNGTNKEREVTIAGITKDGFIHFGVAISRPGDVWNKKRGTKIASGRANVKPLHIAEIPEDKKETPGKFFNEVADQLAKTKIEEIEARITSRKKLK